MKAIDWFLSFFDKKEGTLNISENPGEIVGEIFYKDLAIQSSINLIANTITKAEFLTFEKGEKTRKDLYYLLNVEPNQNKSASKFWRDVVTKLVYENECLVIQQPKSKMLYVAESFDIDRYAFKENVYKNIVVEGYELKDFYYESQVLHFELHDQNIRTVIDGLYNSYSKLIASSQKSYKKNKAKRGTLEYPINYTQTDEGTKDLEDLLNNRFKRFFDAENGAVLPLTNKIKYTELEDKNTKATNESSEIRKFIDDIFDFIAIAFQIPPKLLKGDVADTESIVNNFLTFCINPIAELLTDEINRKLYGKKSFLESTYCKLDTTNVKVVELGNIANALDVLTRIGAYSIDDSLRALGMEPLNKYWSKIRFMTKNYQPIKEMLKEGVG